MIDSRVATLEAQVAGLALRSSVLEWILEQHFSRYLLDLGDPEAAEFLAGIASAADPFTIDADGVRRPADPKATEAFTDVLNHVVGKIAERVEQGVRRK